MVAIGKPLVELRNATVAFDGRIVLSNLNWKLSAGKNWLVEGENGAGKSTFLKLVAGKIWPVPDGIGRRIYRISGETSESPVGFDTTIAWLAPEEQQRYQQRDWRLTAGEIVVSGTAGTDLLYERPRNKDVVRARRCMENLGLAHLWNQRYDRLSQGELRQILIARCVVGEPMLLIFDEIYAGLDGDARLRVSRLVSFLCRQGAQILMTAHRSEDLLPEISHRLVLRDGGIRSSQRIRHKRGKRRMAKESSTKSRNEKKNVTTTDGVAPVISIEHANVYPSAFDHSPPVLKEISWQIRTGESWAVTGPNGSGKSTLLRFVYGDFTCAVGGKIERYSGGCMTPALEARREMSYLSAEMQADYPADEPVWRTVASGFSNQFGFDSRLSANRRMKVKDLLLRTDLAKLEFRKLDALSFGEVRKVLIARALVAGPSLVLLDEPFDGLDTGSRAAAILLLDRVARSGTQLIIVSHHAEDFPSAMTHSLCLNDGRVVSKGPIIR